MSLWSDPVFRETAILVVGTLVALSVVAFFLRNRSAPHMALFASLGSWTLATPFLLGAIALPSPWPLVTLSIAAIFGLKSFFQIMGMYHRSYFVWASYVGIAALGFCIDIANREAYNVAPMTFLGVVCLIPLLLNSPKQMIQYLALTLVGFMFLGWSFMHLGWIWRLDRGPTMVVYIVVLTEVFDNLSLFLGRLVGHRKIRSKISPRRNWEGFVGAALLTTALAFQFRHLLSDVSKPFWLASAATAIFGGSLGDMVLSVFRRDLGIKDVGVFIIGRGDLLSVMDRLIFVAPIFYYVMWYLESHGGIGL